MNIIFMGTPDFAVTILDELISSGHNIQAVITQPDKPKGRGKRLLPPPVKEYAIKHEIEVLQPQKIRDPEFIESLRKYDTEVFVVAAYGQILPESVLYMPKFGSVNVHGSLLPKYRGAAPIQRAIIDGEKVTGVTIMQMDKGLDTGGIILQKEIEIAPDDTSGSLYVKMANVGAVALIDALEQIKSGKAVIIKQDDTQASYAAMITKETARINWRDESEQIINLIRGLDPQPGAYTFYEGEKLKIWKAEKYNSEYPQEITEGTILEIKKNFGIAVKTGDGGIVITQLQGVSGKIMSAPEYLRGHVMEAGKQFVC